MASCLFAFKVLVRKNCIYNLLYHSMRHGVYMNCGHMLHYFHYSSHGYNIKYVTVFISCCLILHGIVTSFHGVKINCRIKKLYPVPSPFLFFNGCNRKHI